MGTSARDPKYTIVPQRRLAGQSRERLDAAAARAAAQATTAE